MGTVLWHEYAQMLGLAVAVLERADPEPPWPLVLAELTRGLHSPAASLAQARYAERTGRVEAWRTAFPVSPGLLDSLLARQVRAGNPLVAHYASTPDRTPRTASELMGEGSWLRSRSHRLARGTLGAHMLAIPLPAPAGVARGFVLHHERDDFTAEERAYAGRVQPLLVGIDCHYRALARWRAAPDGRAPDGAAHGRAATGQASEPVPVPARVSAGVGAGAGACIGTGAAAGARTGYGAASAERAVEAGLTPRQHAVLTLLAKALPATAIAHRLHISPRTAHKHIEGIYRRLGTCDRLSTVMRAQSLGLLPLPRTVDH
ncbi:response regulator transcription factor [Streptomyces sp. NPDC096310]|uniref:helix-turn-helix transcriptional regulator n=1 Tax=Streptomyces sp. NPDC096310 TaxID=3366082 RepID=UPI0037F580F6